MRYPALCAVVLLASGCALPVPLQVASWAASGLSYATTGKGISDHAVSAVTEQDCAMHRIALGKQVCLPFEDEGTAIAANAPEAVVPKTKEPTARLRDSMIALAETLDNDARPDADAPETPPLDSALLAMADTLNAIDRTAQSPSETGKHYLVIGRYRALDEAEKVRTRHAALGTKVRMVLHEGALLYQVTAGPFERGDALDLEAKLKSGGRTTRVAMLCADGVTPAPCGGDAPAHETALRRTGGQFTK